MLTGMAITSHQSARAEPQAYAERGARAQVCDFNLSRVMEESAVLSSMAATNPRWLAPEILGGRGYTFSSDIYSFGIILWEFLTWRVPWWDCGPWQVHDETPPAGGSGHLCLGSWAPCGTWTRSDLACGGGSAGPGKYMLKPRQPVALVILCTL